MNKLAQIIIGVIVFLVIVIYLLPWMALPSPFDWLVKLAVGFIALGWLLSMIGTSWWPFRNTPQ